MHRTLFASLALTLTLSLPAQAQDWLFRYGPNLGGTAKDSFTEVISGSNALFVHGYGDNGAIGLTVLIDAFETGGKVPENLRKDIPLQLDAWDPQGRYERKIPRDQYIWEHDDASNKSRILFLLTEDDLAEIRDSQAIFVWIDSLQFRWSTDGADDALRTLLATLPQNGG